MIKELNICLYLAYLLHVSLKVLTEQNYILFVVLTYSTQNDASLDINLFLFVVLITNVLSFLDFFQNRSLVLFKVGNANIFEQCDKANLSKQGLLLLGNMWFDGLQCKKLLIDIFVFVDKFNDLFKERCNSPLPLWIVGAIELF